MHPHETRIVDAVAGHSQQQLLDRDACFDSRQRGADAVVNAETEGEVLLGVRSAAIEYVRFVPKTLVAVAAELLHLSAKRTALRLALNGVRSSAKPRSVIPRYPSRVASAFVAKPGRTRGTRRVARAGPTSSRLPPE
jgi:hypothetical protein